MGIANAAERATILAPDLKIDEPATRAPARNDEQLPATLPKPRHQDDPGFGGLRRHLLDRLGARSLAVSA
ncbi:hypothetical protein [Actinoplanes philippinensis]|uniref:hypothetical protein n=1 Tax=Actinoplanes philippinensis TaxID=35752 RepID=UPI0033E65A2A